MSYKKLTPIHPLYKKVEELHDLLDKLNITISSGNSGQLYIEDNSTKVLVAYMDIEHSRSGGGEYTTCIPYSSEYKLVIVD